MRLELTASSQTGDPAHPVTVRAEVTNLGRRTLYFGLGCTAPGIRLILRDPDGRHVSELCGTCPNHPCPACPDMLVPLRHQESFARELIFSGVLHDCAGEFEGAPGEYRVEASFDASTEDGDHYALSRSVSFRWSSAESVH